MKEVLRELLAKKKMHYKDDYNEMLGDYKRELETTEGYNSRQILELLQNCDDEAAKEVSIHLDTHNKTISISNDGSPFSEKGYRSLFIANLSSKTSKRNYIGNKGLGFRSIINWSNKIDIISNGISLQYSQQNLREVYETIFSREQRLQIADEEGLNEDVIPMAMLSIPEINEIVSLPRYSTTITITYKESFLQDIIKQLNALTSDIFLFLRSIETVIFRGIEGKQDITCLRENVAITNENIHSQQNLILNDRHWSVYSFEEELPDELTDKKKKEKDIYQISIAIEENMGHSSPFLYSFFPTNIKLNQPYVLHATFDLDPTRNQINDTEKNRFILKKIVDFTIVVAKHLSEDGTSYAPLKILFHNHKADTLAKFDYYTFIDKAIHEEPLFPCVNGNYITLDESLFISNELADLVIEISAQQLLNCHLIATKDELILKMLVEYAINNKFSDLQGYSAIINSIAAFRMSNVQRAKLIKIIVQNFKEHRVDNKLFNLLVDNHGNIIPSIDDTYTPSTYGHTLDVPSYAKIQFMNSVLYDSLLDCYAKEEYEKRGKSRFVYDILKDHCNIHSFEPITLAEKIIRATYVALELENSNDKQIELVQEMFQCLFNNYQKQSDKSKISIENVPSITKSNSIRRLSELHLSEYYPTGDNVELIFEGIYRPEDYVASPALLGIKYNEPKDIEMFLVWLGVNSYFKYTSKSENEYFGSGNNLFHHPFLFYTKKYRKDNSNYTGYKIQYLDIEKKELLFTKLDIHRVITLAVIDQLFRKQLNNQDKTDSIELYYRNNYHISNSPSFIKYNIITNYKTDGYLLDEKYSWVNDFEIDYNHSLFVKFGINKIRVNEALLNLGAVESFNDLNIVQLTSAFQKLNGRFPDGTGSQQFYKKTLAHYDQNKLRLTQKVKLFARAGHKLALFDQDKIYFSDNNFLPSSLSADYPIFNFPLRAGAKKAIHFFGINDLNTLKVTLLKVEHNDYLQTEFTNYFNDIKPYVLAYRLEDIEKADVKDDQVLRLNNLRFSFCKEVYCKIQDNEFPLTDYNYIYDVKERMYYIKSSINDSLDSLRQNPLFVDNFSEILLNVFATSTEKSQFESILRDNKSTIEYNLKKVLGDSSMDEARLLLGMVNSKKAFWKPILQLKNIVIPDNEEIFESAILELLKEIDFPVAYDDPNNEKTMSLIEKLFKQIQITASDFNKISPIKISTYQYNIRKLNNHLSSIESGIKQVIFDSLIEKKGDRKFLLNYFNSIELVKNKYEGRRQLLDEDFEIDCSVINNALLSGEIDFIDFNNPSKEINYGQQYKKNKCQFTAEQITIIESYPEIHSLLYFDELDSVKDFLQTLDSKDNPVNLIPNSNEDVSDVPTLKFITNIKTNAKSLDFTKSSIYKPTLRNNHSKILGNKAEDLVFNKLVEMYGERNVIHKSKETEWEHYDIKYSKDGGVNWIYVEVKSAAQNKFSITIWEKEFGENNADCYEIWVLKESKITAITNFFEGNPILNPIEFEVIFDELI